MTDIAAADTTADSDANKGEVPLDENDISLRPNPLLLLLREQRALEALFAVSEDESLARLDLLRAYHRGLQEVACRALASVPSAARTRGAAKAKAKTKAEAEVEARAQHVETHRPQRRVTSSQFISEKQYARLCGAAMTLC